MAEQMKSITDARQNLPSLSQSAQEHMERFVITNQGRPQSVLIGYEDYRGMQAATELALRPDALESLRRGMGQMRRGEKLTAKEVMETLPNDPPESIGVAIADPETMIGKAGAAETTYGLEGLQIGKVRKEEVRDFTNLGDFNEKV